MPNVLSSFVKGVPLLPYLSLSRTNLFLFISTDIPTPLPLPGEQIAPVLVDHPLWTAEDTSSEHIATKHVPATKHTRLNHLLFGTLRTRSSISFSLSLVAQSRKSDNFPAYL